MMLSVQFFDAIRAAAAELGKLGYTSDIQIKRVEIPADLTATEIFEPAAAIAHAACSVNLDKLDADSCPDELTLNPASITPKFDKDGYPCALSIRVNENLTIEHRDVDDIEFIYTTNAGKQFKAFLTDAPLIDVLECYLLYAVKF